MGIKKESKEGPWEALLGTVGRKKRNPSDLLGWGKN